MNKCVKTDLNILSCAPTYRQETKSPLPATSTDVADV